ncbi:MAG TPA: hypothetical protein VM287_09300 [Egibacteraceae bacterium]|nr:hypothetical protein [Egibacteraceae bacterium]
MLKYGEVRQLVSEDDRSPRPIAAFILGYLEKGEKLRVVEVPGPPDPAEWAEDDVVGISDQGAEVVGVSWDHDGMAVAKTQHLGFGLNGEQKRLFVVDPRRAEQPTIGK